MVKTSPQFWPHGVRQVGDGDDALRASCNKSYLSVPVSLFDGKCS
jgi:hypothetical protein